MRQKLLLLAAVFFGVLAFMFTWQQISYEKQQIANSTVEKTVIVLTRDLVDGDVITEKDIKAFVVKRYRTQANFNEILWSQRAGIIDKKINTPASKNDILTYQMFNTSLTGVAKSGLAHTLEAGTRALSIPVDNVSSVAGLVKPLNYVDVIGTFRFPDAKGDSQLDTITVTILQRVKIIACGTDLGNSNAMAQGNRSYSTVTLELLPSEVEMIVFAQQKGRLTLSLRNPNDPRTIDNPQSVDWNTFRENIDKMTRDRKSSSF